MSDQTLSSLGRDPVAALEFGTADFYNASFVLPFAGFLHTEYAISPAQVMDEAATMHFDFVALADHRGDVTFHFGDTSNQPVMGWGLDSSELADPLLKNYNTPAELISSSSTEFGTARIRDYGPELYLNFVDEAPISTFVMYQNGEFFKPDGAELCTEYGTAIMIYDRNVDMLGDVHTEMGLAPRAQTDPPVEFNFITTKVATSSALHFTFSGERIIRLPGYEDSNFSLSAKKSREFVTTNGFTSTTYGVPGYTHEYGWLRLSLDFAYDWPGDNISFYFGVGRGFVPFSISSATQVYSPTFIPDHVLDFDQDPHTEFGEWEIMDDRQHCNLIGAPSFVEFGEFGVGYRRHVELIGEPEFTQLSPVFIANYTRYLTLFSREAPPDDYGDTEFISRDQMLPFFGDAFFVSQTGLRITKATVQEFPLRGMAWPSTYYDTFEVSYTGPLHILIRGAESLLSYKSKIYNRDQYIRLILPASELPYFTEYTKFVIYHRQPQFYEFGTEDLLTEYDDNSISTDPHLIDFNPQQDNDPLVSIDSLEFGLSSVGTTQYVGLIQWPPTLRMTNPKVIRWLEIGLSSVGVYGLHTVYGETEVSKTLEFPLRNEYPSTEYSLSWFSRGKQFVTIDNAIESLEGRFINYIVTRDRILVLDEPFNEGNTPMTAYGRLRTYPQTHIVKIQGEVQSDSSWFGNKLRLRDQLFPYLWNVDTTFGDGTFVGYDRREVRMKEWPPQAVVWLRQVHSYDRQLRYGEYDSIQFDRGSIGYQRTLQLKGISHTEFLLRSVGHSPRYLAFWGLAPLSPQYGGENWVSYGARAIATGDGVDDLKVISKWGLFVEHVPPLVAGILTPKSNEQFGPSTQVFNQKRYLGVSPRVLTQMSSYAFNAYNLDKWREFRSIGDTLEWPYSPLEIGHDVREVGLKGLFASILPATHMTWVFNELTIEDYTQFIPLEGADHLGLDPNEGSFDVMSATIYLNGYEATLDGTFDAFGSLIEFAQTYFLTRFGKMRVGTPIDQWVMLESEEGGLFTEMIEDVKCPRGLPGLMIIPTTIQLSSGNEPIDGCRGQAPVGDFLEFNERYTYPRGAFEIMTRDQTFFMHSDYPYSGVHTEMGIPPKFYRRPEYVHLEGKHSLSRGPLEVWPYPQTSFQFGDDHLEFGEWLYEGGGLPPIGTNPFTVTVTMHGLLSEEFTYYVERFNRFVTLDEIPESLVFGDNHPWISYPRGFEVLGETHTIFEEEGFGYVDYGIRSVIIGDFESFEPIYSYNSEVQQPYGQYFFSPIQDDAGYGHFTIYTRDQKVLMFGAEGGCPPQKVTVNHA